MRLVRYPFISKIIFPKAIKSFPAQAGKLFLSFDDGPTEKTTPIILDILKQYNCKASFFCLGENVLLYPHLIDEIKKNGHTIGNHGYSHINGFKLTTSQFLENIEKAAKILKTNLFRPPYGKMKIGQYRAAKEKCNIILWDTMSYDFDSEVSPKYCAKLVIKNAKKGSIIVFHDNEKSIERTQKALPIVIEHFLKQDCLFDCITT